MDGHLPGLAVVGDGVTAAVVLNVNLGRDLGYEVAVDTDEGVFEGEYNRTAEERNGGGVLLEDNVVFVLAGDGVLYLDEGPLVNDAYVEGGDDPVGALYGLRLANLVPGGALVETCVKVSLPTLRT